MNIGDLEEGCVFLFNNKKYMAAEFSHVPGYRKCYKLTDLNEGSPEYPFVYFKYNYSVTIES